MFRYPGQSLPSTSSGALVGGTAGSVVSDLGAGISAGRPLGIYPGDSAGGVKAVLG